LKDADRNQHMRQSHSFSLAPPMSEKQALSCLEDGCASVLSSPKTLRAHMKALHGDAAQFWCDTCHRGYSSKFRLSQHTLRFHRSHSGNTASSERILLWQPGIEPTSIRHILAQTTATQ
jgi:hypothetical protein